MEGDRRHARLPSSSIFTDEHPAYRGLIENYEAHFRVHHAQNIYVSGDVHRNTIEGFCSTVKSGIRGVFHSVSTKWLHGYLNEYAWRYNHRPAVDSQPMFETLLLCAAGELAAALVFASSMAA